MKKLTHLVAIIMIAATSTQLKAQSLEQTINKNLMVIDSGRNLAEMTAASQQLDQAASKHDTLWVASYYAAYGKIMLSFMETDNVKKDALLAEADHYLSTLTKLHVDNDETNVLQALLLNAKIAVDPVSRSAIYGTDFGRLLQKAKSINPNNPRLYYVKGLSLFYTPKAFGGGKEAAKTYFEKAVPLFSKEPKTSFLKIHWGKDQNNYYLSLCK